MIAQIAGMLTQTVGVIRAKRRMLDLEKSAGLNEPEVPRDRFLKSRFRFPAPSRQEVVRAFEIGHTLSEIVYAGDGYWDCPGEYTNTLRYTSNRVLGYISGYRATGIDIYRQRALEGMEYILRHQSPEGDFPWYYNSNRGVYNRNDGLFEAGIAGRMFIEGYRLTGDERWLEASEKTARWEMDCPISPNNNYNMFAVWHLASHYEVTKDKAALESAVEKTRLGGMPGQLKSGGWPEHNSWMWYHGIIVRGMAALYATLPDDHPFKEELRPSLTAAINRAIREQAGTGEVTPNPKIKCKGHTCPFILNGLLEGRRGFGDVFDNCIFGLMRYRIRKLPDEWGIREYASAWKAYSAARDAAISRATGEVVWRADFGRFVKDVEWGEVVPDAFNCWYPCNEFDPACQQWRKCESDRTCSPAQEIVSCGAKLFGGMGWSIPGGVLIPGRRYRFSASVKCKGDLQSMPLVMCSAYAGKKRPTWDPFSECNFSRENSSFEQFSEVSVTFTASREANYVYVWAMGSEIGADQSVSLIVDEASISDAGAPLPKWDHKLDDFDSQTDMLLLPTGIYLEEMF